MAYDITDRESFNNINNWLTEVKKHAGPQVIKFLVGNKCDLENERKVSKKEGQDFADSLGIQFLETSAKEKINIDEIFIKLASTVYESLPESERNSN